MTLAVLQVQDSSKGFLPPVVELYVNEVHNFAPADLRASQARELAAGLLAAAERLEANR